MQPRSRARPRTMPVRRRPVASRPTSMLRCNPTYTNGKLCARLDTGTASGSDWFILTEALSGMTLSVTVTRIGGGERHEHALLPTPR
jgi:hypothetical protein